MHLDDSPGQRQSNAQAGLRAMRRSIALAEEIEDTRQHLARNADAGVRDRQHELTASDVVLYNSGANRDLASGIRELRCVMQQIREDLHEPCGIDPEHGARL